VSSTDAHLDRAGESLALGLLSFAAGTMDSLALLKVGEVFTSAMSGNTIFFGLALGQGRLAAASHSIAAFAGYAVGVASAAAPLRAPANGVSRVLAGEALLLAAFAGLFTFGGSLDGTPLMYGLIVLSAMAMGLQGAVASRLKVPGIMTIVFTNTLTSIIGSVADSQLATGRPRLSPVARRQLAMFVVYLASAVVVGFAISRGVPGVGFSPVIAVAIVVAGQRRGWLRVAE
jgi:uncharacterized membrane protein YoaK (UPF0700 family)